MQWFNSGIGLFSQSAAQQSKYTKTPENRP